VVGRELFEELEEGLHGTLRCGEGVCELFTLSAVEGG
jgi:hypothetical protein